jgi:hypothetical protein
MKYLHLVILSLISGCSSLEPMQVKKHYLGYRHYDPCIRCGEKFQQLPNFEHEAIIRRQRGEQW